MPECDSATQRTRKLALFDQSVSCIGCQVINRCQSLQQGKVFLCAWSMFQCPSGRGEGKQPPTSVAPKGVIGFTLAACVEEVAFELMMSMLM